MRPLLAPALLCLLLSACGEKDTSDGLDSDPSDPVDADADGFPDFEDCDDNDPTVNPDAAELCDGLDQDCDQIIDEDLDQITWYADADRDGHGDPADALDSCGTLSDRVEIGDDCDDKDSAVYPGAPEACNEADDDCDLDIDEEEDLMPTEAWYPDQDNDGYGDELGELFTCDPPSGYTSLAGDCDDSRADIAPNQEESCDGDDNDCDGETDEGEAKGSYTWYEDSDNDGYGTASETKLACTPPPGYVENGTDCNDDNLAINPGATEICDNHVDEDCDEGAPTCEWSGNVRLSTSSAAWLVGEAASDGLGTYVQGGQRGDHNADGLYDTLVGAPGYDNSRGSAYVWEGGVVTGVIDASLADARLQGESTGDNFGARVAWAGDVANDSTVCMGCDDVLIGAYKNDDVGTSSGAVYLFIGPAGNDSVKDAWGTWLGDAARDYAGFALSAAGDVDGDGNDDLLFGSYGSDSNGTDSGSAYLFYGPIADGTVESMSDADLIWTGATSSDYAGVWVAGGGDVDGDGLSDLLIGASKADGAVSTAGAAYVVLGGSSASGSLSAADAILGGSAANDLFGAALENVGDVNNDGLDDVLVGASGEDTGGTGAGAAYLYYGPISSSSDANTDADVRFLGSAGDGAGFSVAGAGDVNADLRVDLLIGAPTAKGYVSTSGAAYLIYGDSVSTGTITLSSANVLFQGSDKLDAAGYALAGVGDTDNDGFDDLVIGAYADDYGADGTGTLYLILGKGL